MNIYYHASHEQFGPRQLLELAQLAEQHGFEGVLSSDHFHPWNNEQGESGFAWSWLGAAMHATKLPFGIVNAPGQRYHPAIIAQAGATLRLMFPGRFWIALGSGQALNEHITGTGWPEKQQRNQRLLECSEIIRKLWKGETVTHRGLVTVEEARLYSFPETPPMIAGAALTEETAGWAGQWADALITISHPVKKLQELIRRFRSNGGKNKPVIVKYQLSYHPEKNTCLQSAFDEWKTNVFESAVLSDLRMPAQFQALGKFVQPDEIKNHVKVSEDPVQHLRWLKEYADLGLDTIILHNVNPHQEQFIRDFGSSVLPQLKKE